MPRDFPDMESLERIAEVYQFRKLNDGETEDSYRTALADFVAPLDFVESQEIRHKVGWNKWDTRQNQDLLLRSAARTRTK